VANLETVVRKIKRDAAAMAAARSARSARSEVIPIVSLVSLSQLPHHIRVETIRNCSDRPDRADRMLIWVGVSLGLV
jgi:hypothetical protein